MITTELRNYSSDQMVNDLKHCKRCHPIDGLTAYFESKGLSGALYDDLCSILERKKKEKDTVITEKKDDEKEFNEHEHEYDDDQKQMPFSEMESQSLKPMKITQSVGSSEDIRNDPSVQIIRELLITLHRTDRVQKLESEIASDVQQKYVESTKVTKPQIVTAINDVKKRLQWNSHTNCRVYSHSEQQWTDGVIVDITTDEKEEKEMITVKYGDSGTAELQRFSKDLKSIGIDDEEYIPNEEIMVYIAHRLQAVQGVDLRVNPIDDLEKKYSAIQLLDALNQMKYDHKIDENDEKFDEIFSFYTGSMKGNHCDVNECHHVRRHHGNRRRRHHEYAHIDDHKKELLLDIIAMIHCYFVHSFDIDRLTKEERDRVEMEAKDEHAEMTMITNILIAKRKKLKFVTNNRRRRESPLEYDSQMDSNKVPMRNADFVSIAIILEMDELQVKESLKEYKDDRNRLMSDLIDVVYGEEEEWLVIWDVLEMADTEKHEKCRRLLFEHFKSIDLSKEDIFKVSKFIIDRKALQIDHDELLSVIFDKPVDGKVFGKMNDEKEFQGLFEAFSDSDHVVELYNALREWRFIESANDNVVSELKTVPSRLMRAATKEPVVAAPVPLIHAIRQSIDEIKADKETPSSKLKSAKIEKYGDQIIEYFLQNPMVDADALSIMARNEFTSAIVEHCGSKEVAGITTLLLSIVRAKIQMNESEILILVMRIFADESARDTRRGQLVRTHGRQLMNWFRQNPRFNVDDLVKMSNKALGKIFIEICGTKRANGVASLVRSKILGGLNTTTTEEVKESEADVYQIGKRFLYWDSQRNHKDYVKPKYGSIREEVMHMQGSGVTNRSWDSLTQTVQDLITSHTARRVKSNGHKEDTYGIQADQPFDAHHLRALKLYTDLNELCKIFCTILREGDPQKVAEIAHLAKTLTETVQCFGSPANNARKTYYRGVNKAFVFRTIVSRFHLPLSTTSSVE